MGITKIHQFGQGLFDKRGICYWACEYLTTNMYGPWLNFHKMNYSTLRSKAESFTKYSVCINWAKSQRSKMQADDYNYSGVALTDNHCFRVGMYIGEDITGSDDQNHEIICITGDNNTVLVFDPNTGFWEFDSSDITANNNREVLEHYITEWYKTNKRVVRSFEYKDMGAILS